MQFHKLSLVVGILILAVSLQVNAGEAEAEGGGKGGAEGGDEKSAAGAKDPAQKAQHEFVEKTSKLNGLSSKIEEAEKRFQEAVKLKSETKSSAEKQQLIKQMNEAVGERNKAAAEYNKVKADLTLRYPNQGEHLDRHYQTQTNKSNEELEGAAGLDELLTRTKKIVEKKFATFAPVGEPKVNKKLGAATEVKGEAGEHEHEQGGEKPKPLRLEK